MPLCNEWASHDKYMRNRKIVFASRVVELNRCMKESVLYNGRITMQMRWIIISLGCLLHIAFLKIVWLWKMYNFVYGRHWYGLVHNTKFKWKRQYTLCACTCALYFVRTTFSVFITKRAYKYDWPIECHSIESLCMMRSSIGFYINIRIPWSLLTCQFKVNFNLCSQWTRLNVAKMVRIPEARNKTVWWE